MLKDYEDIIVDGEPIEVTEIRKKILHEFKDLEFKEEGHEYTLNGKKMPSVSEITHKFGHPFDTEECAKAYAIKHGETAEYWKDKWRFKSLKATTTGTLVHSYGESMAWLRNGFPNRITQDNKCKYIEEKGWLVPTRPKEEAIMSFFDELNENLHFVLAETKVYSGKNKTLTNLKQDYCGTFDLLMYYKNPKDESKSGLVIFDYKTNADLHDSYSRQFGKMLYSPFDDLYDESLGFYTLQLSCYQMPLEDIGLKVVGRRIIHLKDDATYELVPIPCVTDRLREVL